MKIKTYRLEILGVVLGALGGYIYWYFWGCEEGCSIRSVWWRMSLWGAVFGGLALSALKDQLTRRSNQKAK